MKNLLIKIWGSPFFKNTSYLVSGTAIAQAIGVLLTPILSRYYTPLDFGILGGVVTLAGILSTFGTLKYEMGIVQADSKKEVNQLAVLSTLSLVSVLILFSIIILIFPELLKFLGIPSPNYYILFLTVFLALILGLDSILIQWQNRLKAYYLLSKKTVLSRLTTVFFQLVWGLIILTGIGLVYGNVIGGFIGIFILLSPLLPGIKKIKINFLKIKSAGIKYYRFAVYTAPQNLLNAVSQGLPILMLGRYFGETEVGAYFFTMRILQLPSALISKAIKQVFYKEAAEDKYNIEVLKRKFFKLTFLLAGIIVFPLGIIFFFGEGLFAFIFGAEWAIAGEYASWMFLWVGLMFINPPASAMYLILNKQKEQLFYETVLFVFRLGALLIGGGLKDILFTIKLYSLVGVVFNLIYISYISFILKYGNFNRR